MKRKYGLLAWLICLVMVLSLAGCGKKDEPKTDTPTEQAKNDNPANNPTEVPDNPTETPAGTIEDALKKAPEHYDFAVEVSINPAFLLFVSGNEVIGYQAGGVRKCRVSLPGYLGSGQSAVAGPLKTKGNMP